MGVRAFLIGNGPSLADTPLDLLKDEVTFACNRINLIYPKTVWRPTYYLGFDWTGPNMMDDVMINIEEAKHSFIRADRAGEVEIRRKVFDWPQHITYFWHCTKHVGLTYPANEHNAPRLPTEWHLPSICGFGSTLGMAAQVAVMLGFGPLYLLGCDLGFVDWEKSNPDPNHFDPAYIGYDDGDWHQRDDTLRYMHSIMETETHKRGIKIINLTPTNGLDGIHQKQELISVLET